MELGGNGTPGGTVLGHLVVVASRPLPDGRGSLAIDLLRGIEDRPK